MDALKLYKPVIEANEKIAKKFEEKGLYILTSTGPRYDIPLDTLFDRVRGIKNTLIDLRRRPQKVKEACDKIHEMNMKELALTI